MSGDQYLSFIGHGWRWHYNSDEGIMRLFSTHFYIPTNQLKSSMAVSVEDTKFVTLTLTNQCNLACSYCYEKSKNEKAMSFETAVAILESELNSDDPCSFLQIELFGGEPFLEFNKIRRIVSYLRSHHFKKEYLLTITTNGTLVHGEIQDWLVANKDIVSCGLSLDGTRDMHNINRSGSFDKIDLDFFSKNYSDRPIKMTVSKQTLGSLCEGVIFCHSKGFSVFCNLAYGEKWDENDNDILARELRKLIDFYLNHPGIVPCSMLFDKFSQILVEGDTIKPWCSAGTKTTAYSCDGTKYPCQYFMPLSGGSEDSIPELKQVIPIADLDQKCRDCAVLRACPTCYGYNYQTNGDIHHRDEYICAMTKTIIKARSYLVAELWKAGCLNTSEQEEQALLRAIVKIQNEL